MAGKRRHPEDVLPLRIEIDQFFNFIRAELTSGDSTRASPLAGQSAGDDKIAQVLVAVVREYPRPTLDNTYIQRTLQLGDDQPHAGHTVGHPASRPGCADRCVVARNSFYDRLRFLAVGHATHVSVFKTQNQLTA